MHRRHAVLLAGTMLTANCARAQHAAVPGFCRPMSFENQSFTVCHAESGRQWLRLMSRARDGQIPRSFSALPISAATVVFAMNAGMFDRDGAPIGLLIVDGSPVHGLNRSVGGGNFGVQPNGVFYGDAAGWHLATTDAYAGHPPARPAFATQSGPMLVITGGFNARLSADSPSRYVRNGVGVNEGGDAWFAISDTPVSFGRFARLFRDKLRCPDALYLDGAVSSLWDPAAGRRDDHAELGPIIVALRGVR